ncbi:hypothetical protein DIT71_17000 [Marinobacter vulgaris]|uniref:Uncharacterized protein n=2 Tax=Marinobacter vulgaris TaxID=1928331 RepID=A0A2V3ZEU3_9GAMM|nr:oligosaccharide flippase family protein [Marinobacter vulgaris]PXX88885.1 hypothetical protein DIT71_17000 [Marinobacter vulgaris]
MSKPVLQRLISYGQGGSLRAKLIRGGAGVGGLQLLSLPISFVTSVLMARTLGVEDFGVYSYVLGLVVLFALPAYAGFPPFLVREVSRYHRVGSLGLLTGVIRRAHQVAFFLGILIMLAVLGFVFLSAENGLDNQAILIITAAVTIPLLAIIRVRAAILQGLALVIQSRIAEIIIRPIVFLLLILTLFFIGTLSPLSALFAQITATVVTLVVVSILLRGQLKDLTAQPVYDDRRWKKAILPFSAIAGVSYLNSELIIPLTGFLASNSEVAFFKVALSIAILISAPLTIVEATIHPHVTRVFASGEKARLFRMVSLAGFAALLASLPLVIVFLVFGQEILEFVYGLEYTASYWPLAVLITGFLVVNLVGPSMLLLHATNYENDALVISIAGAALTILLCVTLIPREGALGAALAITISKVARALAFRIWAQFRINQHFQEK